MPCFGKWLRQMSGWFDPAKVETGIGLNATTVYEFYSEQLLRRISKQNDDDTSFCRACCKPWEEPFLEGKLVGRI